MAFASLVSLLVSVTTSSAVVGVLRVIVTVVAATPAFSATEAASTSTVSAGTSLSVTCTVSLPPLKPAAVAVTVTVCGVCQVALVNVSAAGETVVTGAEELRVKESDRIATMSAELRAMGAQISEKPDGMVIQGQGRAGENGRLSAAGKAQLALFKPVDEILAQPGVAAYRYWDDGPQPVVTGNPVRSEIESVPAPAERFRDRGGALSLLRKYPGGKVFYVAAEICGFGQ